jgi:hypothetical protein
VAAVQPKNWQWWYDRLIDWMIAHPEGTMGQAAIEFKTSESWLSVIKNSDMFKDRFAVASKNASDVTLLGIKEKGLAAAEQALDALNKRLETQAAVLPVSTLLEITDITMKRFGYATDKKAAGPAVQNNYFMGGVSQQELSNARANMNKLAVVRREATELVPVEGESGGKEDERGVSS